MICIGSTENSSQSSFENWSQSSFGHGEPERRSQKSSEEARTAPGATGPGRRRRRQATAADDDPRAPMGCRRPADPAL